MLFKSIVMLVFMLLSIPSLASPDMQERAVKCQTEAAITQFGFASRVQMDKEEFEKKIKELREAAAKDPEVTNEQLELAIKALKQGFAGLSPQKAFDACMSKKQI